MLRTPEQDLQGVQAELSAAQAELAEISEQLRLFEAKVDARLGSMLDQITELNAETALLDGKLRHIREEKLFGSDLMKYLDGAPTPAHPTSLDDIPPVSLPMRGDAGRPGNVASTADAQLPEIKVVYRRLARRYHPDLARNDGDRALSNDQMKLINQAYTSGDLRSLMRLAGMSIPYGAELKANPAGTGDIARQSMTALERAQWDLREARQKLNRLSSLPLVKLSLEVKLARHQGRDLLNEMSAELQYKIARKTAERDYLKSQIDEAERQRSVKGG